MIGTGLIWSDRDLTRGRSTADRSLLHGPRSPGAHKHAGPDEPSRLPWAAARPACALRVREVRVMRVCQHCTRSA